MLFSAQMARFRRVATTLAATFAASSLAGTNGGMFLGLMLLPPGGSRFRGRTGRSATRRVAATPGTGPEAMPPWGVGDGFSTDTGTTDASAQVFGGSFATEGRDDFLDDGDVHDIGGLHAGPTGATFEQLSDMAFEDFLRVARELEQTEEKTQATVTSLRASIQAMKERQQLVEQDLRISQVTRAANMGLVEFSSERHAQCAHPTSSSHSFIHLPVVRSQHGDVCSVPDVQGGQRFEPKIGRQCWPIDACKHEHGGG